MGIRIFTSFLFLISSENLLSLSPQQNKEGFKGLRSVENIVIGDFSFSSAMIGSSPLSRLRFFNINKNSLPKPKSNSLDNLSKEML